MEPTSYFPQSQGFMQHQPQFTNTHSGGHTTINNYNAGSPHEPHTGLTIKQREWLEAMSANAASFDAGQRSDPPRCHEDTRVVILDNLHLWFKTSDPDDNVWWIYGGPGVGKSAIAQSLAERLSNEGLMVISFFFWRSDSDRNHTGKLIPTIAYQIATTIATAASVIAKRIGDTPKIFEKSFDIQWQRIILDSLYSPDNPIRVLFIIDGVDECEYVKEQAELLRLIFNGSRRHGVFIRYLITSRPETQIQRVFEEFGLMTARRLELGKSESDVADLRNFTRFSLGKIYAARRALGTVSPISGTWPDDPTIEEIVERADGQFIYMRLLSDIVDDENEDPVAQLRGILERRQGTFKELDALYLVVMERAMKHTPPDNRQLLMNFLTSNTESWKCKSSNRVDFGITGRAWFLRVEETKLRIVLGRLQSVLTNGGRSYRHKSFGDFLLAPSAPHPFKITPSHWTPIAIQALTILSTKYLSTSDEHWDIWGCVVFFCQKSQPCEELAARLSTFEYNPEFWISLLASHGPGYDGDYMASIEYHLEQRHSLRPYLAKPAFHLFLKKGKPFEELVELYKAGKDWRALVTHVVQPVPPKSTPNLSTPAENLPAQVVSARPRSITKSLWGWIRSRWRAVMNRR